MKMLEFKTDKERFAVNPMNISSVEEISKDKVRVVMNNRDAQFLEMDNAFVEVCCSINKAMNNG